MTPQEIARLSLDGLHRLLADGHAVDADALAGTQYRGVSLGVPKWVERLSWTKFRKSFRRAGGAVEGFNTRLVQNGLDAPDEPMTRRGTRFDFGPYEVCSTAGYAMPRRKGEVVWAHRGLLLDYGKRPNPPHLRALRDPLVAVHAGDTSLLLGWSYLDLGVVRLSTPSFFTLERPEPLA